MRSVRNGFTLIELVLVFAIVSILALAASTTFNKYNQSQIFQNGVSDFVDLLNAAKSQASSQVVPTACAGQSLNGYQVIFIIAGPSAGSYELDVVCGGAAHTLNKRNLPSNVSFAPGSTTPVLFSVLTGSVPRNATVVINGYGKTRTVTISTTSNISVQ